MDIFQVFCNLLTGEVTGTMLAANPEKREFVVWYGGDCLYLYRVDYAYRPEFGTPGKFFLVDKKLLPLDKNDFETAKKIAKEWVSEKN